MTTAALEPMTADALRLHPTRTLLMAYAFLAPLGNIARFSSAEASYGATTALLAMTVAINLLPGLRLLRRDRLLFSLALLTGWMGVVSVLAPNVVAALSGMVNFAMYVLFACAAYRVSWSSESVHRVLLAFVLGGFLSSALTIVDFFGIVNVPGFNEGSGLYTATSLGAVLQASGPFPRRSAMAAYFALLIPVAALMWRRVRPAPPMHRLLCAATAVTASVALLLTHNRAGLLGAWLAVAIISLVTAQTPGKFLRLLGAGAAAAVIATWVLVTYFPEQLVVYEALLKIGDMRIEGSYVESSDRVRLILFKHAVTSLLSNPVGNGFTLVTGAPGHPNADAHNIITQIIWAAGLFGIGWMLFFGFTIVRRVRRTLSGAGLSHPTMRYGIVIAAALLGWAICGMMHQILGTGMAWLLGGVLLKLTMARVPDAATAASRGP